MQIAKAEVLYSNTIRTVIITLPGNAVIWNIYSEITIAFNDTGTDFIAVGIPTIDYKYMNGWNAATIEFTDNNTFNVPDKMGGSTNIVFTYSGENGDATQGEGFVYVHYTLF